MTPRSRPGVRSGVRCLTNGASQGPENHTALSCVSVTSFEIGKCCVPLCPASPILICCPGSFVGADGCYGFFFFLFLRSATMILIGMTLKLRVGIPGWRSGLAPAFGPGRDPGDPGSNPTSGSRCMEPASPSAYVSASLSLCDYHK